MKQEHEWLEAGQGRLRELADEIEFMDVLQPRERGVCLLCDGAAERYSDLLDLFERLAKQHIGTQFCHLELENAGVLVHAVDLDHGVPVVFVTHHGKVTTSLTPPVLFERGSASSPKFRAHVLKLLWNAGAMDLSDAHADSDSDRLSELDEDCPPLD